MFTFVKINKKIVSGLGPCITWKKSSSLEDMYNGKTWEESSGNKIDR